MANFRLLYGITIMLAAYWSGAALAVTSASAEMVCYDDWSESAAIIKEQKLISVEDLSGRVRSELDGKIVKTTLCKEANGFVYVVVVRSRTGRMETVRTNALAPKSKLIRAK